jgi:hypothetical protein
MVYNHQSIIIESPKVPHYSLPYNKSYYETTKKKMVTLTHQKGTFHYFFFNETLVLS